MLIWFSLYPRIIYQRCIQISITSLCLIIILLLVLWHHGTKLWTAQFLSFGTESFLFRGKSGGEMMVVLFIMLIFLSIPWNLNYINYIIQIFMSLFCLLKAESTTKLYFNYVCFEFLIIFALFCIYAILYVT